MHLQASEKRYLDPRPLVEACKHSMTNLQNDVYDQNDASEFLGELLDKVENAMKAAGAGGAGSLHMLKNALGGELENQKIPKEGEGLETTTTKEPFYQVELKVRGMESIEASLGAFVEVSALLSCFICLFLACSCFLLLLSSYCCCYCYCCCRR